MWCLWGGQKTNRGKKRSVHGGVPELDGGVVAACCEVAVCGTDGEGDDKLLVRVAERAHDAARSDVPAEHGAVVARAAHERGRAGHRRERADPVLVPLEHGRARHRAQVPHAQRLVARAAYHDRLPAGLREAHRLDDVRVPRKHRNRRSPCAPISSPHAHGAVLARCRDELPCTRRARGRAADGGRAHPAVVPVQRADAEACLGVPHLRGAVARRRHERVRARKLHARHRVVVSEQCAPARCRRRFC